MKNLIVIFNEDIKMKKNIIVCAGIISAMLLAGCGVTDSKDSGTVTAAQKETQETVTDNNDTTVDAASELSAIMAEIYNVNSDSANVDEIAEKFKNYTFSYGQPSSSATFEEWANDWFKKMEESEGKDVRSEFKECFQTVTSAAQSKDETLEYDVAYTNVVNGILAAMEV